MTYQFDTEHAKKYGVDEAILIQNFVFWIAKNKANNKHEHDGRTWTYNSYKSFAELFDFWSKNQIRTRIESLVEQGVIIKGSFSKNSYDRTTWYAFKDEKSFLEVSQMDVSKITNRSEESNNSSINTDNKPYKNKSARESLPDRIQKCDTVKALSDIWYTYRKKKGRHANIYEKELTEHEINNWGLPKSKKIISVAIRNGWINLKEDYLPDSKKQKTSPFRPDAILL